MHYDLEHYSTEKISGKQACNTLRIRLFLIINLSSC